MGKGGAEESWRGASATNNYTVLSMTPQEMSDRIAAVLVEVSTWTSDPRQWGRSDLDASVEVWDRLDRLRTDLAVLHRDHSITLARRIDNEQRAFTRDGAITIHRDTPRTERWDGHGLLGELAQRLIDANGELVDAVPVDVLRAVVPACGQGQTSSRWKITELRRVVKEPESFREVDYGDAVIARGPIPSRVRHARPPAEPPAVHEPDTDSPQPGVQPVDNGL